MKKLLFPAILMIWLFSSCSSTKNVMPSISENQAYMQLIRGESEKYSNGIDVYVNENQPFRAKVAGQDADMFEKIYVVNSGKSHVTIEYQGNVVYDKDIFVSPQETIRIQLP